MILNRYFLIILLPVCDAVINLMGMLHPIIEKPAQVAITDALKRAAHVQWRHVRKLVVFVIHVEHVPEHIIPDLRTQEFEAL